MRFFFDSPFRIRLFYGQELLINDFGRLLNATSAKVREMESAKKAKEQRIRDIDDTISGNFDEEFEESEEDLHDKSAE